MMARLCPQRISNHSCPGACGGLLIRAPGDGEDQAALALGVWGRAAQPTGWCSLRFKVALITWLFFVKLLIRERRIFLANYVDLAPGECRASCFSP
ncbi:hypothetical protein E2C01_090764 [Portunus trituberculatus]|uniref:Uncharacterized protein n=1 Tax=Portunus trituberculatus TaxID=210409 RepID=A0A5B7JR06_PORTR|nr:hypothetical protein [Portunus trituberculatus]